MSKETTTDQPKKKLNPTDIAIEAYLLKARIAKLEGELVKRENLLKRYFDKTGQKAFSVDNDGTEFRVLKVESLYIQYDVEALKENLDPDLFSEITEKKYTITNIQQIKNLLKNSNVPFKLFKKWISVETKVNTKAINHLFDMGTLKLEDIEGCYEATLKKRIDIK